MQMMIIGYARKPHAFKGKTGEELGFDYHHNQKGSITKALFYKWLHGLEIYFGGTPGRKVLLLLDNCSAHGN